MRFLTVLILLTICTFFSSAKDLHVSKKGNDNNDGSVSSPYLTITTAANVASPGDVVIVHEGIYRERITPPRGGNSDSQRIIYQAAEGEKAEIRGSEVITGWKKFKGNTWKVSIPNTYFGSYNPYLDIIAGDWFTDHDRIHHTGMVYINGKSGYESSTLEDVINPKPVSWATEEVEYSPPWFCETDEKNTYIYVNLNDADPNKELVEINVRECCFYPETPGIDYITVSGFYLSQAATQWAPPTAEQIGLIGTHWSKGWIIENNVISHSRCTGITLGKDRETGQNVWSNNPAKDGATHYNEVVFRALRTGWSKEEIGSHIVRNNTIFNCEQAGIVGSLGAVYSLISNNHIYNIWAKRLFSGAEMAGIKIHASIDVVIENNHIHHAGRGIWIDWMAQGTRITGNLLHHNTTDDLFSEVNHGPYLVDNNLFLSDISLRDWSEGGAFVHNLFAGVIAVYAETTRFTPYHFPHSTEVAGLRNILGGDDRFYNNIFIKKPVENESSMDTWGRQVLEYGLAAYKEAEYPITSEGNIYYNGAKQGELKSQNAIISNFDPVIKTEKGPDGVYLHLTLDNSYKELATRLVTTGLLEKTITSGFAYENPDGSPLIINKDYYGKTRNDSNPTAGPFENPGTGMLKLKIR